MSSLDTRNGLDLCTIPNRGQPWDFAGIFGDCIFRIYVRAVAGEHNKHSVMICAIGFIDSA